MPTQNELVSALQSRDRRFDREGDELLKLFGSHACGLGYDGHPRRAEVGENIDRHTGSAVKAMTSKAPAHARTRLRC